MFAFLRRRGVFLALLLIGSPLLALADDGLDIMRRQRELHRAKDEQEKLLVRLIHPSGATKERRLARYTVTSNQNLSKILIRFLAPRDVENTGLLTWEKTDGDDDQWLYLPATRKTKRIASSGKKNRFMGTDFAFEDLRPENLSAHAYTLLGSETLDGQDCHVIEAAPANERQAADSGYSKRKIWVRKDNLHTVQREYYGKTGKLEKVESLRNLANVKGTLWRADEIEMRDVQAGTRTVLTVESRALDKGLKESFLTEAELTRDE